MTKDDFARRVVEQTDSMYRVSYTLLRNDADCRDAMQEAALKAWEKRNTLIHEKYFSTWLTRILINECYSVLRKRGRTASLEAVPEPASPPPDPTLAMLLQALPRDLRLPLMMQAVEGMTYLEIARALNLPYTTVVGRIHRAKKQLRKELEA